MADPVSGAPEEARVDALPPPRGAFALLRRRDFRRVYVAVSASELGDALQYIALMWFAFEAGGPLGVLAVRLADSVPRDSTRSGPARFSLHPSSRSASPSRSPPAPGSPEHRNW
jgi:hypothetical protein